MSIEQTPPNSNGKVWINGTPVDCLLAFTFSQPPWVSTGVMPPLLPLAYLMTPQEREAARLRELTDALTEHFGDTDPRLS